MIPQIHDRLFRTVFRDRREAAALLRPHLPAALAESLDWSTLTLADRSYIDEDARESELDLLFTITRAEDRTPLSLYVLLEHQSEPRQYMRVRLLKYCCRIWEQAEQEPGGLRAIVPVVFYQGRERWRYSREMSELFAPVDRQWPWVPRFAHVLIDQSQAAAADAGGQTRGRIALLALMAAFRDGREQLDLGLRVVRLLAALPRTGRFDIVRLFVHYLLRTQDAAHLPLLDEEWQRRAPEAGGDFVTIAEMLVKQGRQEGRQEGIEEGRQEGIEEGRQEGIEEGRLATLEKLARSGAGWSLIESAADGDAEMLQALRQRLAEDSADVHAKGADQPDPPG